MKILENIKKWMLQWIWILLIFWIVWITYAATIWTVSDWETLTAETWNSLVNKVNLVDDSTSGSNYIRIWDVQIAWWPYTQKTTVNLAANFLDTSYSIMLTPY